MHFSLAIIFVDTPHQAHNLNKYGKALMSAPSQAIVPNHHTSLLNVYIQITNKLGFQQQQQQQKLPVIVRSLIGPTPHVSLLFTCSIIISASAPESFRSLLSTTFPAKDYIYNPL
jgi:hypothetical protein